MRPISSTQHCASGNVCEQMLLEIPEVTCMRRTIMGFLHETSLIWVISLGVKLWLVYFRSLHICKNYHTNDKYMIKCYNIYAGMLQCKQENKKSVIITNNIVRFEYLVKKNHENMT